MFRLLRFRPVSGSIKNCFAFSSVYLFGLKLGFPVGFRILRFNTALEAFSCNILPGSVQWTRIGIDDVRYSYAFLYEIGSKDIKTNYEYVKFMCMSFIFLCVTTKLLISDLVCFYMKKKTITLMMNTITTIAL